MIYLLNDLSLIGSERQRSLIQMMPPERREKAMRFRFDIDRTLCVAAYWLLMLGLRREYGIAEPVEFVYGQNGKPSLKGHPDIHFNLTHGATGAACALSDGPVGIDLEPIGPYDRAVAQRVCHPSELARLDRSDAPEREFCRIWTLKESHLKRTGQGISDQLPWLIADEILEKAGDRALSLSSPRDHLCCLGETLVVRVDGRGPFFPDSGPS